MTFRTVVAVAMLFLALISLISGINTDHNSVQYVVFMLTSQIWAAASALVASLGLVSDER